MKDNVNVGGNFNGIAPLYDTLAFVVFGRRLQQAQVVWLNQIPANAVVLIVGGGTGWLLEQVLERRKPKRVVYLEASAKMVARASRRMIRRAVLGSVDFRVGDETDLKPEEHFDAILTPFVLDLFTEQTLRSHFIPQLHNALKPNGLWLVTDFVQPHIWWQKALLWTMIRFFGITAGIEAQQLANWQQSLAEAGLVRQKQQQQVGGMVSTEVWELEQISNRQRKID
ncbi:class I SAM-dependent methyltransferase [Spirosoma validum]|uniref:Class I SAM-dependent methyltransferase n=1 Tax=Spirosoma validum TaxID=2771355 RepID=A0A927B327_9BACT|nr:class I SAM-dependent methyltransferase [Spirosoma validum]MBD2754332.1 class I SAM-dependent methyltransferase [Spirosoma validum]